MNDEDEIIGKKPRAEIDYKTDIFRTASLWITNGKGDVLLAQRKLDKKVDPGKWAEAVGGTVEDDDTYEETIIRETKEEVGLVVERMSIGPKQFITTPCSYFVQWYTTTIDQPIESFSIQDEEVEQIAWISVEHLRRELVSTPDKYIDAMPEILHLLGTENSRPHVIVYSHGFGVEKDDRGLFTTIASTLPGTEHVMFDYNHIDSSTNTLTVSPLDEQATMLNSKLRFVRENNPNATIDIICHSQGCVVAALAHPLDIRKVLFLAPPTRFVGAEQKIQQMSQRDGTIVEDETVSYPRRDGSTTIITSDYWKSRNGIEPIELYNRLSENTELTIINASQDEVLGEVDVSGLSVAITIKNLDANHDFTGGSRQELTDMIRVEISTKV